MNKDKVSEELTEKAVDKNNIFRDILMYISVFAGSVMLLVLVLVLSALIPEKAIKSNMLSSADFLCEKKVFFNLSDGVAASIVDRYADSILLNISYNYDGSDPLRSVMKAEYYYTPYENENDNFRNALNGDYEANQQYLRYWHGSGAIVRTAHMFTDIRGMYITGAVLIAALTGILLYLLIKYHYGRAAFGIIAALAAVGIWFVPFSLQYTWIFLVMPAASIIAVIFTEKCQDRGLCVLFLVTGIITNYLDFLTCETVTLLVPLLLVIHIRHRKNVSSRSNMLSSLKLAVLWAVGYAGMWIMKWFLASIVLGEDVMPYITDHIAERIGDTRGQDLFSFMTGILPRNIGCLFPLGYGGIGVICTILLIVGTAYVCFVYRTKGADIKTIILYAISGIMPYIRYLVLLNHSYLHYFFTYRAQAASVLAVCLIISELTDRRRGINDVRKRKRRT